MTDHTKSDFSSLSRQSATEYGKFRKFRDRKFRENNPHCSELQGSDGICVAKAALGGLTSQLKPL